MEKECKVDKIIEAHYKESGVVSTSAIIAQCRAQGVFATITVIEQRLNHKHISYRK